MGLAPSSVFFRLTMWFNQVIKGMRLIPSLTELSSPSLTMSLCPLGNPKGRVQREETAPAALGKAYLMDLSLSMIPFGEPPRSDADRSFYSFESFVSILSNLWNS